MESLDELEIFELMQAMYPDKYADECDDTYCKAIEDWEELDVNGALSEIIPKLILLTPVMQSPLTKTCYHTLGKVEDGYFRVIVKREELND